LTIAFCQESNPADMLSSGIASAKEWFADEKSNKDLRNLLPHWMTHGKEQRAQIGAMNATALGHRGSWDADAGLRSTHAGSRDSKRTPRASKP
jgi:hypothetical protein